MELKTYFAQDAAGNIISSAIVKVFLQGTTTLATGLTRADGTPLENPFAADGAGRIQFRAPDGYYDIQVSAGSGIIQTLTIQCVDYSGAKADADRAEAAADRADVSAEEAQDALNSITGINTNFEQNSREQWRRSLAEAGVTLVDGSFEEGATATKATDAVWYMAGGQCYTWEGAFNKAVPANSTPQSTGDVGPGKWQGIGNAILRTELEVINSTGSLPVHKKPFVTANATLNIGNAEPDKSLRGTGKVQAFGIDIGLDEITYNPAKENVLYTPGSYLRQKTGEAYPTRENPDFIGQCYRFVLSQGSKLDDDTKNIHHVVAVGNTIGCSPIDWQLVDAFGGNALMYAGRVSRTTAIGSESMAWFGAPDQQWLIDKCHDYWRKPAANPYLPGEPGWDTGGLETNFPGMGARLAAYNNYVTSSDDAGYCASLGRDAMNHIVRGVRNASGGYQSMAYSFDVSYCAAFGALALQSMVFGGYNTAVGDSAGRLANDCYNTTFIGYGAGRSVRGATGSVFIGDRTADSVLSATKAVIIGPEAGKNYPAALDNLLIINNQAYGYTPPLLSGDFSKSDAGVAIYPNKIRARFHIRFNDSGSTLTPQSGALVEGNAAAGLTVETNSTGFGSLRFADPQSNYAGGMEYSHASDSLVFFAGAVSRVRIDSSGHTRPSTSDNTQNLGSASNRWAVLFAGTGAINTSNETHKTREDILDAEKAAALEIKRDIWKFKFKDAIDVKGEGARIHFGVGAQSVGEILRKHGLNPDDYAFYCYDKWEAEYEPVIGKRTVSKEVVVTKTDAVTGFRFDTTETVEEQEDYDTGEKVCILEAGENYGIRYEELLCFIMAAI